MASVVGDGTWSVALAAAFGLSIGGAAGLLAGRWHLRANAAANQRLQTLLTKAERVAQLGIGERDLKSGQSHWSSEFHAILGLVPGQVAPSQELFLDTIHPVDRAAVEASLHQVRTTMRPVEKNFRIVRPSGEIRIVHGRAEISRDAAGVPVRLDAIIQDVTERKRLEDELDGLIRELWRSNEELEQFAYVASHDLRQPLRVVGSYVSLMEEELQGNLNGDAQEYMAFVRDGVRRMDRLINDLLTYSRVGRIATDKQVSMCRALDAAIADLQFEIEDSGGAVRILGELPSVLGDESELERLFQNLIGNAVKYRSPDRPPLIEVGCKDLGEAWKVVVTDNGIGIPAEHAERVFGIFQRLHARNEFDGTGVGLAIAKKIVERHGGTIWVEPSDGEGASLSFTWPKVIEPSEVPLAI
ncbi:PAS domain-containing sensor histidine kinase [Paramagnetospirillum kuznetsovii]|uniref:histidine kinase n=1 Tax=Paramagnetospirillum kuznetsovii TaxID=2053833 RepID=A0A364NVF3_9PROT|nr:ATP-binding protein [Paramagnetospirillum kuznetsovii]RAU20980.1 PAS domain-containing sensor histidine kinase [Paramagnetospirillum kuznetsovii]